MVTMGTGVCLLVVETRDNLGFGFTDPSALDSFWPSEEEQSFARRPTLQVKPELTLNVRVNEAQSSTDTGHYPQAV